MRYLKHSSQGHLQAGEDGLEVAPSSDPQYNSHTQEDPQVYYVGDETRFHSDGGEKSTNERSPSRKLGLPTPYFWLLIILATILAIGISVGGALGGILSKKNHASSPSSATISASTPISTSISVATGGITPASATPVTKISVTPTSVTSATSSTTTSPSLTLSRDCPGSNGTIFTASYSPPQTYIKHCSWIYDSKFYTEGNAFSHDASTLDQCIELCAAYNILNATGPLGYCTTVGWRTDLTQEFGGMCFGNYGVVGAQGGQAAVGGRNIPADSALYLGWIEIFWNLFIMTVFHQKEPKVTRL